MGNKVESVHSVEKDEIHWQLALWKVELKLPPRPLTRVTFWGIAMHPGHGHAQC